MVDKTAGINTDSNLESVVRTPTTTLLAILFHLGMLTIVFSGVYTVQPPTYGTRYFALTAALGVAVLVLLLVYRTSFAASITGRALTALMAGICYSQAYDPQLTALLPAWGERLPMVVTDLAPSLGTVGLLIAAIGCALYLAAGGDRRPVQLPFGWSILVAALLAAVLGVVMYLALAPLYELQGGMYTILLLARLLEYTLLLMVVQRMAGARGIGAITTAYLSLGLVAAVAHNMLSGPM